MDQVCCKYKIEAKRVAASAAFSAVSIFVWVLVLIQPPGLLDAIRIILIFGFPPFYFMWLLIKKLSKVYFTDERILWERPLLPKKEFYWKELKDQGEMSLVFANGKFSYQNIEACPALTNLIRQHTNRLRETEIAIGYSLADRESSRQTFFLNGLLLLLVPALAAFFAIVVSSVFHFSVWLTILLVVLVLAIVLAANIKIGFLSLLLMPFVQRADKFKINRSGVFIERSSKIKHYAWNQVTRIERNVHKDANGIFYQITLVINSEEDLEFNDDESWFSYSLMQSWSNRRFLETPIKRYQWSDTKEDYEEVV